MGKTLGLILIVIASGLLIYWALVPSVRQNGPHEPVDNEIRVALPAEPPAWSARTGSASDLSMPPAPPHPLSPPRTSQQEADDALEAKRTPYYDWIRRAAGDRVSNVAPSDDDKATLVLTTRLDTPEIVTTLAHDIIYPYAAQYGFRHVRFYVPNGPGDVERYRFDAEANCDNANNWAVFKK